MTMPEHLDQDRPLDPEWLAATIERALDEDLGAVPGRDVTTQATISATAQVAGDVVMRTAGVIAGVDIVAATLEAVAHRLDLPVPDVEVLVADGDLVAPGTPVASIAGRGHVVLIAERTLLNLMSRASGVATHTRAWTDALAGTGASVLDTRKTTPGLRELDKFAVRCGGGVNKRMGLFDCAMIKDNHIVAAGSVADAIAGIRTMFPDVEVQVEVETDAQVADALAAGARFLMLDNMSPARMSEVVARIREGEAETGKVWLEATGGLTLDNAREVALTGVDYMSVGALTHSSPIADLALDLS